jgi:hypothetical protein
MTERLHELTAGMIVHIAHTRGWTLEQAADYIRAHMAEARGEYRSIGAPYGDDDRGFYLWLTRRPTTPTA